MTQSVTFHFTSPQFLFESGTVVFTKGARLFSEGEFRTRDLRDGCVDGVLVEGPIQFDAMLVDLRVVRREGRRSYYAPYLKVTGDLRPDELRAGRVTVRLNLPVAVIVRVEDLSGKAVSNVSLSLLMPDLEGSLEARTDDRGEVVLLGGAGRYTALIDRLGLGRIWKSHPQTWANAWYCCVSRREPLNLPIWRSSDLQFSTP
jgi:hypothetical protein